METQLIRSNLKQIYDLYRTSLLNAKYYGYRLEELSYINAAFEIVIAVGAAGSGVAGWAFWQDHDKQWIWAMISGLSVLFAAIKPALGVSNKIKQYTELWSGYQMNYISLKRLCSRIVAAQSLTADDLDRFNAAFDRHEKLAAMDAVNPNRKLLVRFQNEVNTVLPPNAFWWPSSATSKTNV